jgi:hypothetical protein
MRLSTTTKSPPTCSTKSATTVVVAITRTGDAAFEFVNDVKSNERTRTVAAIRGISFSTSQKTVFGYSKKCILLQGRLRFVQNQTGTPE